ncbi:MAG: IS66 family transposase [Candidatus Pacebacteria bacterium]|nr:IS66 family transposase [Candidatus Paceibacterota bacterium]
MKSSTIEKYKSLSQASLLSLLAQKDDQILLLNNRVLTLQHYLFGHSKEKSFADPAGLRLLFNEADSLEDSAPDVADEDQDDSEKTSDNNSGNKKKSRGKRKALPADLPRLREEFDLSEQEKVCPTHNVPLTKIGEKTSEKLDITPAKIFVIDQIRMTYKCPCCSAEGNEHIVTASKDPEIIPGSIASSGLLATIVTYKYMDHLPLHRLEQTFKRIGIDLNRTSMARWMIACSRQVQPLLNLMRETILSGEVAQCDETVVQVLNEPGRAPEQNSYMWVLARQHIAPILLYCYFDNRGKSAANELLDGFTGTLMTDALKTYECASRSNNFKLAACWAHSRRRFFLAEKADHKALKAKPKEILASTQGLTFIRQLYKVEGELKGIPPEETRQIRRERSKPILDEFRAWLEENAGKCLPKSLLGKAISYTIDQWTKLVRFLDNGLIPLDNNYVEAHIRPFVIGRNNWTFSATPAGAQASAALYSLVETAKANGICPHSYLSTIFKELPKAKTVDDFERLLPYNIANYFTIQPFTRPG